MKNFKIKSEFFGGIILNSKNTNRISIDMYTYDFLNMLSQNISIEDFINKYNDEISKEDLLCLLNDFIDIGIIHNNFSILQNDYPKNNLSTPFRVFYDITYGCNLRCKHCFTESGKVNDNELSFDEKLNLISQLKELGVNRISIAGGEPLYCKDIFEFLENCKLNNISVSLTTNGTYLSKNVIEKLNKLNLKNLTISLDGGTVKSIESIRGIGSYDKILNGLNNLKKYYNNTYSIKTTIMKNNINEIDNIINIALDTGCNVVKFNCVRLDGRANKNLDLINLTQEDYINTVKKIESLKEKFKNSIKIKAPLNIFCNDDYDYIPELGFGCFAGKESICISPIGDVKPCSHFPKEFICGNIRTSSLYDIWNNSPILKQFRNLKGNPTCKSCNSYDKCRAGCRYRSYLSNNINDIDPFCYLNKNIN